MNKKRIVENLVNLHDLTSDIPEAEAIIEDLADYCGVYDEYESWVNVNR